MKRVMTIATASVAAVLLTLTIGVAAQDFNPQERTYLTFSAPVELPGMTLPAGEYTFRLADTPSRNVVQVLSRDEKEVHGQFLFVQAQRPEVTGQTVITFRETKEGTTPAVHYWYYPGEKIGKEFVYPKDQAMRIAARTGEKVLSTEGEISANSSVSSVDASGTVTPWQREQTSASASQSGSAQGQVQGTSGVSQQSTTSADSSAASANQQPATTNAPSAAQPTAAAGSLAGNRGVNAQPEASISTDASRDTTTDRAVGTSGSQSAPAAQAERAPQSSAPAPAPAQTDRAPRQEATTAQNSELPRTASPLALTGLLGLLSCAGALGVRMFRS